MRGAGQQRLGLLGAAAAEDPEGDPGRRELFYGPQPGRRALESDRVEVVVFGHSHQYFEERVRGRLWLNPGSCSSPRFGRGLSMAIATIENGVLQVEKIAL